MELNFIGERFKYIRTEIFKLTQQEFVEEIRNYIIINYKDNNLKKVLKEIRFTQNSISSLESESMMTRQKFVFLINYLHLKKRINPSWILLENNKDQKLFITKLVLNESIVEKQKKINEHFEEINKEIKDIDLIIRNSNKI